MPLTPHIEKHFLSSALVRDIVIGMADGLTVPLALAAGLSVDWTAPRRVHENLADAKSRIDLKEGVVNFVSLYMESGRRLGLGGVLSSACGRPLAR
jgi:hypothetical protein